MIVKDILLVSRHDDGSLEIQTDGITLSELLEIAEEMSNAIARETKNKAKTVTETENDQS